MKVAKLAARVRRGRRRHTPRVPAKAGTQEPQTHEPAAPEHHARKAMRTLRAAGVDTYRVPDAALEDFVESHAPPPARHRPARGRRSTRADYHAWLSEKE